MISARFFKNLPPSSLWIRGGHLLRKLLTMGKVAFNQNPRLLSLLLVLPVLAWLLPVSSQKNQGDFSPEKVNLAMRRTADALLRASGDSTSRIPAIEQPAIGIWRVRLEQPFDYDQLPALLQASLDMHGIRRTYEVAVRRCDDETIELGYHQLDYIQSADVPCGGRAMPDGCHFIEVKFLEKDGKTWYSIDKTAILLLVLGGLGGFWLSRRKKAVPASTEIADETDWMKFGNSRLDVAGQVLICGGVRQTLTFRESKLLRLFVSSPDQLLERDLILQQVWADEGILVGRSVDVFVSRLRKKLAGDPSVGITAVHGVGYRLETGKVG